MFSEIQNWVNILIYIGTYVVIGFIFIKTIGLISDEVAPKIINGQADAKYYLQLATGLALLAAMYMFVPALVIYSILQGWYNVQPYIYELQVEAVNDLNSAFSSNGNVRYNDNDVTDNSIIFTTPLPPSPSPIPYELNDNVGGGTPEPTIDANQPNVTVVAPIATPKAEWHVGDQPSLP